jgi:uncharacterized membrane protein
MNKIIKNKLIIFSIFVFSFLLISPPAFACDSCYKSKKGYEQQGDKMNCKNCNQKFAINRLGPNATGGCNPGYLPHQQSGNVITISVSDLKSGARYF